MPGCHQRTPQADQSHTAASPTLRNTCHHSCTSTHLSNTAVSVKKALLRQEAQGARDKSPCSLLTSSCCAHAHQPMLPGRCPAALPADARAHHLLCMTATGGCTMRFEQQRCGGGGVRLTTTAATQLRAALIATMSMQRLRHCLSIPRSIQHLSTDRPQLPWAGPGSLNTAHSTGRAALVASHILSAVA
jgi:hypothetical protein